LSGRRQIKTKYEVFKSFEALLGYGIDAETAKKLVNDGYTVTKLKYLECTKLKILGLSEDAIAQLGDSGRPPIPAETVFALLWKCKRTCCICRTPNKNIIVHHIDEWSKNKSHDEDKLAVLCLGDHGEAHTKRELSKNLTPEVIRDSKMRWEQEVREQDARAVIGYSNADGANWDYLNHERLFRLTQTLNIDLHGNPAYQSVLHFGMINKYGDLLDPKHWHTDKPHYYLYQLGEGRHLYWYTTQILAAAITKLGIVDLTDVKDTEHLGVLARPGTLAFFQGPFYFKKLVKTYEGTEQPRRAKAKLPCGDIEFVFNAWECTSSSSHGDRLSGRKVASVLATINDFNPNDKSFQVSCLAIGTFFRRVHWTEWHVRMHEAASEYGNDNNVDLLEPLDRTNRDISNVED
jgi:hypothetical protein